MINLINIVSFFLVLCCNGSTAPGNMKKETDKTFTKSAPILNPRVQTSKKLQTETITVSYAAIACGCPQWFETKFKKEKFLNNVTRFYLEPTNKKLVNANDLWDGQTLPLTLKLVGRFSKDNELPKTYMTKSPPEKAKIFWYDKIIIISASKIAKG